MSPTHPPLCALALAAASIRELAFPPSPPVARSPGPGGGEGSRTRRARGDPVIPDPPAPNSSPIIETRSRSRMAAITSTLSHTPVHDPAASRDTDELPAAVSNYSSDDPAVESNDSSDEPYESNDGEPTHTTSDDELPAAESNDCSDDVSDDGESSPNASHNEQETGLDSRAAQDQTPKQKKARKPRKPNQLTNETFVITRVDGRGVPASPVEFAKGYSNAIGCIVRETVKITCTGGLRAKEHENLRQRLLDKLFSRYVVPDDDKERVKIKALGMMTRALNTWRTRANAMKEKDFETVIKKKWPQIDEEDWKQFLLSHTNDEFKQKSEWGKHMRLQNKFNHHNLGSRGYLGKKPKWDKEDAAFIAAGKEPPFSCIEPGRGRDFLRARASYDPVTGEPVFKHQKLAEVFDKLKKHSQEPQSQSSQDSVEGERWEDPLSKALGGKEVGGRVRGVGNIPWKIYFPQTLEVARQRRRARYEREGHFEERVAAVAEATLRRILAERDQEQGRPPLHPDTQMLHPEQGRILAERDQEQGRPPLHHGSSSASVSGIAPTQPNPVDPVDDILTERDQEQGRPPLHPDTQMLHPEQGRILAERDQEQGRPPLHHGSSSASVSGITPGQPNPIDDITVITLCQLMAPMLGSMLMVAHGQVHPKTMHCVDLEPDMARVHVTKVLDPFVDLKISDHPEPEGDTLGQLKGHVIKWPKAALKLCGTSTGASPSSTTAHTQPLAPSPLGLCAPLPFVDLDGDHGAEHDMPNDKDQAIVDTLPLQHEPAAKTILSPKSAALGAMVQRRPNLRSRNMEGEGKRRDEPAKVRRGKRRRG